MKQLKSFFSVLLALCLLLSVLPATALAATADVWDGTSVATEFAGGSGTESDPYQIATGAQLAYLASLTNSGNNATLNKYYVLTADINLNNHAWTPIGDSTRNSTYFKGTFIGGGHTISNLSIETVGDAGLFGIAIKEICDLTIENGSVTTTGSKKAAGALAGSLAGTALICNCHARHVNVSAPGSAGGLIGSIDASSNATVRYCDVTGGTIKATAWSLSIAGGVVGACVSTSGNLRLSYCACAADSVTSNTFAAGGILGSAFYPVYSSAPSVTITDCYNTAPVSVSTQGTGYASGAGGILGYNKHSRSTITNCYNTGNVAGAQGTKQYSSYTGGIVGYGIALGGESDSKPSVTNCYNSGIITTKSTSSTYRAYSKISPINAYASSSYFGKNFYLKPWTTNTTTNSSQNTYSGTVISSETAMIDRINASFSTEHWVITAGEYPTLARCPGLPQCTCGCHCTPYAEPLPQIDYTLTYDANGGEGGPGLDTYTGTDEVHTFTVSATQPTREGYTFLGWADTADATVVVYLAGDPITVYQDNPMKTIYAVWEKICEHGRIDWTDNGNGTHKGTCHDCGTVVTPSEAHTLTYKNNDDGTHTATCTKCGFTETTLHTYDVNHHCVCGAEDASFTVYYSSENTENKIYMSECEGGYSFTDKVHAGYLYGGVYADNTYMETSAYKFDNGENGIHFTPKAGETYYVREIGQEYLKMKLIASYKGSDVLNIYLMAGLDGTYMDDAKNVQGYMAIGFLENAGNNANPEGIDFSGYTQKNASAYYNSITISVSGEKHRFAPAAEGELGFGLNAEDKLYYYALGKNYVDNNRDGETRNVIAYYKTCDGVIVTGTEMCTFSIVSGETNVQGFVRTRVPSRIYSASEISG